MRGLCHAVCALLCTVTVIQPGGLPADDAGLIYVLYFVGCAVGFPMHLITRKQQQAEVRASEANHRLSDDVTSHHVQRPIYNPVGMNFVYFVYHSCLNTHMRIQIRKKLQVRKTSDISAGFIAKKMMPFGNNDPW